jgi:hypothetical protein
MSSLTLTAAERARMESTHHYYGKIVPELGKPEVGVCGGCGMAWPCPGRRHLDYKSLSLGARLRRFIIHWLEDA